MPKSITMQESDLLSANHTGSCTDGASIDRDTKDRNNTETMSMYTKYIA